MSLSLEEMIDLPHIGMLLYTALELNLPQQLQYHSKTVAELCRFSRVKPDKLTRLLFTLETAGIFAYDSSNEEWSNNSASSVLLDPEQRALYMWDLHPFNYCILSEMLSSLRSQTTASELALQETFQHFVKSDKRIFELYMQSLKAFTKAVAPLIKSKIDLTGTKNLLEIGREDATLLCEILNTRPGIHGDVFEEASAVEYAGNTILEHHLEGRIGVIPGDVENGVPEGFDTVIMKSFLHNWDDDYVRMILRNCKKAMAKNSQLYIIEMVLDKNSDENLVERLSNLQLMLYMNGKERSLQELRDLLSEAGFNFVSSTSVAGLKVIKATA